MSTDFQQAREALGVRLRELRVEAGLNGKEFAARVGWQPSKVSRLEKGRQTATAADVEAWSQAAGAVAVADELVGRVRGLETSQRSWKRQLTAGHRAVQEGHGFQEQHAKVIHIFEVGIIPGIFQIPEYARGVLTDVADRYGMPRDIEDGVRARMKRQEVLYQSHRHFHALLWEGALNVVRCAPHAMAAQLDRLGSVIGLDTVTLGVIPFGVRTPFAPKHGFWIIDERLVIADTWNAELWLDCDEDITCYRAMWQTLKESAVFGQPAYNVIMRARAQLGIL
ncbi:helix-turn-helix transcriptional regulator [Streptomyces sp. NPDC096057]|uniref:helix-turn-helix domain-containing protein n=1 Tax=Streptomyces sp. NPDC096057 TaxID=3155543 RepID=UPI00331A0DB3